MRLSVVEVMMACLANPVSARTRLDNLQFRGHCKLNRSSCMIPSRLATIVVSWSLNRGRPHFLGSKWLFLPATQDLWIVCVHRGVQINESILRMNDCAEIGENVSANESCSSWKCILIYMQDFFNVTPQWRWFQASVDIIVIQWMWNFGTCLSGITWKGWIGGKFCSFFLYFWVFCSTPEENVFVL